MTGIELKDKQKKDILFLCQLIKDNMSFWKTDMILNNNGVEDKEEITDENKIEKKNEIEIINVLQLNKKVKSDLNSDKEKEIDNNKRLSYSNKNSNSKNESPMKNPSMNSPMKKKNRGMGFEIDELNQNKVDDGKIKHKYLNTDEDIIKEEYSRERFNDMISKNKNSEIIYSGGNISKIIINTEKDKEKEIDKKEDRSPVKKKSLLNKIIEFKKAKQ